MIATGVHIVHIVILVSVLQELQQMRNELDIFKGGIAAYEMEECASKRDGRVPVHTDHAFMPSPLRHLPDVETMVKLQQGLQQVYMSNLVRSSDVLLKEQNSMAFAVAGTCEQLHRFPICFHDATMISKRQVPAMPPRQIAVQMYSAMCNMGMTIEKFASMRNPDHAFAFLKATFSASTQDGRQTPYKSDFVLHSVTPVSKAVAVANLQPIPGKLEYAPGCTACFYRCQKPGKGGADEGEEVYLRYVLTLHFQTSTKHSFTQCPRVMHNNIMTTSKCQVQPHVQRRPSPDPHWTRDPQQDG